MPRPLPAPSHTPATAVAVLLPHVLTPQVLVEALGWMAEAIPEFGLAAMDVKGIIEWMKADLGSANALGECAHQRQRPAAQRSVAPGSLAGRSRSCGCS